MFSRNTWRTRKQHKSKEAMCLSAPYKIDFLTKLQSTVEQYRTKQQNEQEEEGRKRNAQWDYHTKIDSQPNWRHKQMRSMSSQWVFWLCGYSSIIEFDDSVVFLASRKPNWICCVTLRGTNCTSKLNHLLCTVDQYVCKHWKAERAHPHEYVRNAFICSLFQPKKLLCRFFYLPRHA